MHAFTHAVDTLVYNAHPHTPTHPHIHPHTPSHILTYTLTHPNHPHILTHLHTPHIHPHTQSHIPTHPHAQHIQIDDQVLKEEDLLEIIVDHPLPDGLLCSCLSLSLCLCHSVCLSVCLSGIVSALHLYSGGSLSAGSCSGSVAGIMSAVATFQQSTPCWGWPTAVWMTVQAVCRERMEHFIELLGDVPINHYCCPSHCHILF